MRWLGLFKRKRAAGPATAAAQPSMTGWPNAELTHPALAPVPAASARPSVHLGFADGSVVELDREDARSQDFRRVAEQLRAAPVQDPR